MRKRKQGEIVEPLFCTWELGYDWQSGWHTSCSDEVLGIESVEPTYCPKCGKKVKTGDLGLMRRVLDLPP